jgi:parallel beta-helix repeat protein
MRLENFEKSLVFFFIGSALATGQTQVNVSNCDIQTAISNCQGSCTISISAGACRLSSPLTWAGTGKRINLECSGRNQTVLTCPAGAPCINVDSNSRVAHCDLRGVPPASSIINGQKTSSVTTDVVIEDNVIEQSADQGLNTGGGALRWTIRDNLFENNAGDGIFLASGTSDSVVADNIVVNNGSNGIDCNGSGNTIHGNIVNYNGHGLNKDIDTDGILISGILNGSSANHNSVVGNETNYNGGSGITIRADAGTTANYNIISGNISHDNLSTHYGADGISIDGSDLGTWIGNTIVGNTVYHNQRHGIEIDGENATTIQETIISSNITIGNGNTGIIAGNPKVQDTLITHNVAIGNGIGQITDLDTTRVLIAGNKENATDSSYVIKNDLVANNLVANSITSQGINPVRLPNSQYLVAESAGNSESLLLGLDGSDQTILRGGGGARSLFIQTSSGAEGASMTDFGLWSFPGGLNIGSGISSDGSGLKHQSVSTGRLHPSSSALITLAWATPFADANYDAQCSVRDAATGIAGIRIHHIQSFSPTAVTVLVVNDARSPHVGTLYCLGMHQAK